MEFLPFKLTMEKSQTPSKMEEEAKLIIKRKAKLRQRTRSKIDCFGTIEKIQTLSIMSSPAITNKFK